MTKTVGIDLVLSAHWRADDGKKSPHLPEGFPEIGWLGHLVTALETCPGHRARLLEEGELAGGAADVDVLLLPVPHGVADRALSPSEEAGLRAFVESGGGLLLIGDSATPDPEAAGAALPLLTGVSLTESLVSTARPAPDSHLLAYGLDATPVPGHAATTGVHALHVHRARALEGAQGLHPLAVGAGGVLAAAGQLGAGRIAVVGNGAMFTLPFLGCADNARFLVNLVQWLSGGEPEAGAAGEATRLITEGHRFSARLFSPEPDLERVPGAHAADARAHRREFEEIGRRPLPDPYDDQDAFLAEAQLRFHELPRAVRQSVVQFAQHSNDYGALLVKGLPVDPRLPDTPTNPRCRVHTDRKLGELWLAAFSSAIGSPFAYRQEKRGLLFQNIAPTPHNATKLSSESSAMLLDFHTETAFHPHMPDYVMLHCLRPDHKKTAKTIVSSVRMILPELSLRERTVLFEPVFRTGVDYSFGSHNGTQGNGPVLPVLYGNPYDPQMTADLDLMVGLTPAAERALDSLRAAVQRTTRWVTLDRGDLLIVDNRRSVHGRSEFTARFDGRDRWLQRTCVSRDLARSAADRAAGARVLETAFAV
ncbi:TauD/TfdA family dioxygenase [Streptomyces sp. NBC_00400]|uniref:TauD/TfdA family dioxygenase n=1 Tax=Streptomyces sp. NBC_00400 TaxID=2975737 RepID=UPI002E211231